MQPLAAAKQTPSRLQTVAPSAAAVDLAAGRVIPLRGIRVPLGPYFYPFVPVLLLAIVTISSAWADDPPGKVAYSRVCAHCHRDDPGDGADGPALLPMYRSTQQVLSIVRGGTGQMHPLPESKVSDAEVSAIVAWLQMQSN
jgi:hypothetical protein